MAKLTPNKRDELLIELKTAVVGMEGTEEKGLAGDIKEMRKHLQSMNSNVKSNTVFRKVGTWVGGILFLTLLSLVGKLLLGG